MIVILILIGAGFAAAGTALHRYITRLTRQLPLDNEDFGIEMREQGCRGAFPSWLLEDPCSPIGAESDHSGRLHPFARATF